MRQPGWFWGDLLTGMILAIAGGLGSLLVVGWRKIDQLLTRVGPAVPGWIWPRLREVSMRQWGYLLKIRTTLWWQQDLPKLQAIIASAELTLCYQLLQRFEQKPAVTGTQGAAASAATLGSLPAGWAGVFGTRDGADAATKPHLHSRRFAELDECLAPYLPN
jgi:hypothetical protein